MIAGRIVHGVQARIGSDCTRSDRHFVIQMYDWYIRPERGVRRPIAVGRMFYTGVARGGIARRQPAPNQSGSSQGGN